MLKKIGFYIYLVIIIVLYYFFILSLMNLYPLYIFGPLLFIAIIMFIHYINNRKKFRGFMK